MSTREHLLAAEAQILMAEARATNEPQYERFLRSCELAERYLQQALEACPDTPEPQTPEHVRE